MEKSSILEFITRMQRAHTSDAARPATIGRRSLLKSGAKAGLAAGALALLGNTATAQPTAAASGTTTLYSGERLYPGQFLRSQNGAYVLTMQGDGNLVIYAPGNVALWSTGTRGNLFLGNQGDGNLVLYTVSEPVSYGGWNSNTPGRGASRLVMQDDGNLVLYPDAGGHSWASNTATSPTADLARQILGNGRITLATVHSSGISDNANARQNIIDTANGGLAARSCYGSAPCGRVALDSRMLRGTLALANTYTFRVSEIAGGSHSSCSRHYAGLAIDVDVINGTRVSAYHPAYRAFMQRSRELGATEVLGPGNYGHSNHIHCAW